MAPFLTAEQRQNVALLDKYKCRVCEKWKTPSEYSKKEHKDWQTKRASNRRLDGVTAKLRCRLCSGAQVTELECMGQCGEWKPLDAFSKAQRTRGAQWCQECVLWKEAVEPGVIIAAAPVNELAPDEHNLGPNAGVYYDQAASVVYAASRMGTEAVSGCLPFDMGPTNVPKKSNGIDPRTVPLHALKIEDHITSSATGRTFIPPHLRGIAATSLTSSGAVGSTTVTKSPAGYVAPHLRNTSAAKTTASSAASSVSNPYERSVIESMVDGGDGWAPVGARPAAINYNAYDNTDVRHSQVRVPSGQTSTAQTIPTAISSDPARRNWARVKGTKRTAPQFPQSQGPSGHYAETYTPPKVYTGTGAKPKKEIYSDGESADEM